MSDFSIGGKKWPGISKLTEECGEVLQVCGKLIGARGEIHHWDGTNLRDRLTEEMGDVLAAVEFVAETNGLEWQTIQARRAKKLALFRTWHGEQAAVEMCEWCDRPVENGRTHGEGKCFDADTGEPLP